ncbi:aromatic ring-hydroxylating dioxygenase subunit alpha [Dokdonella sp.]|uniref:aromatic ring-hydroxylating oxygenase subunit alpha n=1 Tax=Dokdonella sp. TaxID=2291710 RepID=UPI002C782EE4|nr:aromatic ring-hydroxylating dioxygenase subunit alpha [Dokdonella sp.]HOX70202.1 aromatic ring-hydroxylating dioxygenase subunit alpha [Dokdonella sp.]HPN80620.1 aromatic ring-hydroxylating dioxygenase subunit alpha [Dokdonella sp.]
MQNDDPAEALDRAHALPARHYFGDAMLEMEQRAVFARSWQLVARSDQLAEPGDHVVETIGTVPVLLVRGKDEVLRAFPNVCRHRAGPLALCNGKGANALHCKYHGWTYTLEGQLRSAPEMQGARDFDVGDIRLPPLRVHEWQGLVFVALSDDVPAFAEVYAGIVERIAPIDLAAMRFRRRETYDINCNWKVYIDNFLEGYHLPHVHPGLSKVLDYRAYDTELFAWQSLQSSPLRDGGDIYGEGEAFYYQVYPNIMLNIMPGRLQTNRVIPLGPGRCRVEFDFYYAQDEKAQSRVARDAEFSDEVQLEDVAICEAVQRGLASGTYNAGRLCPKRESGVWHFHNLLRTAYSRGEHV